MFSGKNIHKKMLVLLFSALLVVFFVFGWLAAAGAAENPGTKAEDYRIIPFEFQVPIPDLQGSFIVLSQPQKMVADGKLKYLDISWIAEYIRGIYNFSISVLGILCVIMVMVGGLQWLVAGGNSKAISDAKSRISSALMGLILSLGSWTILNFINPDLVNLKSLQVGVVEKIPLVLKTQFFSDAKLLAAKDYPPGFNGVPLYKQCDSRWGSNSYPAFEGGAEKDCAGVCDAGCGPTSLAMVVNFQLEKQGKEVDPSDLMDQVISYASGLKARPSCNGGTDTTIFTSSGSLKSKWNLTGEEVNLSQALDILKNKKEPIVFLVSACGQDSYKEDDFYCKDSDGKPDYSKGFQKMYTGHYMVLTGIASMILICR